MAEISFERLCELEPELEDLHTIARMIRDSGNGKTFCKNFIWYRLFKPKLYRLVGWGRRIPRNPEDACKPILLGELLKKDFCNRCGNDPDDDWIGDSGILGSSGAYDLAYHTIYDQLPDCVNCGCL